MLFVIFFVGMLVGLALALLYMTNVVYRHIITGKLIGGKFRVVYMKKKAADEGQEGIQGK